MIIFFAGLILIEISMVALWRTAYRLQKTSIVDIFWSLLVWQASTFYMVLSGRVLALNFLYYAVVTLWSVRLAAHIYWRGRHHGEDARYRALREKWGEDEKNRMLRFYLQQGLAAWIFSLPFFIVFNHSRNQFGVWDITGLLIWAAAFAGETLSDWQLEQFKSKTENQGKVCRMGFWRYSRHPNYFFEWLNWVAIAWLALPYAWGWTALICPALMYFFLNKVSGVPLAEKQALKTRSVEYAEYQRITSSFFPLPVKHSELLK